MGYQGFSQRLELAKKFVRAKTPDTAPVDQAEKARRKQLTKARAENLLAENLAQRALVQSRRT